MSQSHKTAVKHQPGINASLGELIQLRYLAAKITPFSRQKAHQHSTGQTLSQVRGRGMEFEEVRSYQPGDDIRLINWQMTARMGRPYTKVYQEEREKPVHIIVDQSNSMRFGTRVAFKSVIAARLAALLAWSALNHGDQVGGIVFNESQQNTIPAKHQRKNLLRLLSEISRYTYSPESSQHAHTSIPHSIKSSLQILRKQKAQGALIILISDFFHCDKETSQTLAQLAKNNDCLVFFTFDRIEKQAPNPNYYHISDGTQKIMLNTHDKIQTQLYAQCFTERFELIKGYCQKYNIPFIPTSTEDDLVSQLKVRKSRRG